MIEEKSEVHNGWQPIETAPEDTAVLTYGSGYDVAHFNTFLKKWVACLDHSHIQPTHWMPLPEPPKDAANVR